MANKLTKEQVDECREIFDLFDGDEDGRIATGELVTMLCSLGKNIDGDEATRFLADAGVGEGAAVDFPTFQAVAARKMGAGVSEKGLVECFDVFDDERSGVIPSEQLREVMMTHGVDGDRMTEEEADVMLRKADPRGEGRVEYKKFVKVLLNK